MLQNGDSVAFDTISDDFAASSSANATHRKTGLLNSEGGMGVQNQRRSHGRRQGDWHSLDKKNKKGYSSSATLSKKTLLSPGWVAILRTISLCDRPQPASVGSGCICLMVLNFPKNTAEFTHISICVSTIFHSVSPSLFRHRRFAIQLKEHIQSFYQQFTRR